MSGEQPSMRLADIRHGERYRRDMGDIDGLAASIRANGLLHPVVVTSEGLLVAGARRLAAVARLGWVRVPVRVIDPADLLTAERDENAVRKDFTPSEAAAIAAVIRPVERALARERQVATQAKPGNDGRRPTGSEEVSGPVPMDRGESRERVAAAVGVSFSTLARIEEVVDAAEEGLIGQEVVEEMDRTGNVSAAHRKARAARPEAPCRAAPKGRIGKAPRRPAPKWRRWFTAWCRQALPEDRRTLLEMDAELHDALRAIGQEANGGDDGDGDQA